MVFLILILSSLITPLFGQQNDSIKYFEGESGSDYRLFTPDNYFKYHQYTIEAILQPEQGDIWCCGDVVFPKEHDGHIIQKIECYGFPDGVKRICIPTTVKWLNPSCAFLGKFIFFSCNFQPFQAF